MNVVKQNDAFAELFEPAHRQVMTCFAVMWRCQSSSSVSVLKMTRWRAASSFFGNTGAIEAREAEERRHLVGIAKRCGDIRDSLVDFPPDLFDRHFAETPRVILAVRADDVSFVVHPPYRPRVVAGHFADQEEVRLDALRRQHVEDPCRGRRDWAVIEGENDFVVLKWQRSVLEYADA